MASLLIIEDDRTMREILERIMCERYWVHTADRAEKALVYLQTVDYDAVISDTDLPGFCGVEFLELLFQTTKNTPVIVISANGDRFGEMLNQMPLFAFFSKPFRLEELESAVAQAMCRGKLGG